MGDQNKKIELIMDRKTLMALLELQELLADEVPDGDIGVILTMALQEYLKKLGVQIPWSAD